jgi:hypothetical protein
MNGPLRGLGPEEFLNLLSFGDANLNMGTELNGSFLAIMQLNGHRQIVIMNNLFRPT